LLNHFQNQFDFLLINVSQTIEVFDFDLRII